MGETTVRWRYFIGRTVDDPTDWAYAVNVARYLAEQVDDQGHPLIGGGPVGDARIGPPPEGFKPRGLIVLNPQTQKQRQITVFASDAPLWSGDGKTHLRERTIQMREPDGSTAAYGALRLVEQRYAIRLGVSPLTPDLNAPYCGWRYTTDQGYVYKGRVATEIARQMTSDGQPLIGGKTSHGPIGFPSGFTPRSVTLRCPENRKSRQVVIYSSDAPLWTGAITSVQISEGEKGTFTYFVGKKTPEHWTRRIPREGPNETIPVPETTEEFDSSIEASFWETWQRQSKVPLVRQHPVSGYRLDFAHLPSRTAIELDGYYYHADPERFRKDRQRDRELSEQGWHVVRFAGDEVVADVERCVEEALRLVRAHSSRNVGES